jgi:transcriptional regulator with XRE-family HTH domain
MRNVGMKIKNLREQKNLTQSYMAERLDISQNTYSKIETGGIKLTVDRLKQISEILQESVESILSQDNQVFNFNNSSIDRFYAYIENLQEDNKEILKNSIALLNNQLEHMRNENMKLIDIIAKK